MNSVLLVGDSGNDSSAGAGSGACVARTKRFSNALLQGGFSVTCCSPGEGRVGAIRIRKLLAEKEFSSVVAISPFPAESAVLSGTDLPLWIDINGMHPAELQLQNRDDRRHGERFLRILALENSLLARGDGFSTPSIRQAASVTGELLLLGRTCFNGSNGITVAPIPHCAEPFHDSMKTNSELFRIVSTGSFNIWFDEAVLFKALEAAMQADESIRFTATGGAIPFSRDKFPDFEKLVESSRFKDRFSLPGWVSREELEKVYSSAGAATYTDIPSPETFLGARTRVLDWISRGIPVVCTAGAEIADDIARHRLGIVVPSGDSEALARAYCSLADEESRCRSIREAQRKWCAGEGSSEHLFKDLLKWCSNPVRVPQKRLGRTTVSSMNSTGYLIRLFRELSISAGPGYAAKRLLKRMGLFRGNP